MQSTGHSGWHAPQAMQLSSMKNAIISSLLLDDPIIRGVYVKDKVISEKMVKRAIIRMICKIVDPV